MQDASGEMLTFAESVLCEELLQEHESPMAVPLDMITLVAITAILRTVMACKADTAPVTNKRESCLSMEVMFRGVVPRPHLADREAAKITGHRVDNRF